MYFTCTLSKYKSKDVGSHFFFHLLNQQNLFLTDCFHGVLCIQLQCHCRKRLSRRVTDSEAWS